MSNVTATGQEALHSQVISALAALGRASDRLTELRERVAGDPSDSSAKNATNPPILPLRQAFETWPRIIRSIEANIDREVALLTDLLYMPELPKGS